MLKPKHLGSVLFCWLVLVTIASVNADLIEPTRTLEDQRAATGVISVFSNPPGMIVRLDGTNIGETPVQLVDVPGGDHLLQVGDKSTKIQVSSETPLKISLFQGEFITLQEEKPQPRPVPTAPPPQTARSKAPKQDVGPLNPPNSFYFPINPRGPIY